MREYLLIQGNAKRIPLPDKCIHTVVTSPPYWGLRDYGVSGQLGMEPTPEAYVAAMVEVFREVWRILRDDGTLWINIGDSYANDGKWGGSTGGKHAAGLHGNTGIGRRRTHTGLKPKDLVGIPWLLAFALRADGWYLRSEIIWSKPNPMPESVRDRPTKAHEQVFLLTKRERCFYDNIAIQERSTYNGNQQSQKRGEFQGKGGAKPGLEPFRAVTESRNKRSVWTITTTPLKAAHFATMPAKLALTCIRAGTSAKGCCPICGAPWRRVTSKNRVATRPGVTSKVYETVPVHPESPVRTHSGTVCGNRDPKRHTTETTTLGWKPGCCCPERPPVPCRVFDPFGGAMTTLVAAEALGRVGIATELSEKYLAIGRRRLERPHARTPRGAAGPGDELPLFARRGAGTDTEGGGA